MRITSAYERVAVWHSAEFDEAKFWAEHAETMRKMKEQAAGLKYVAPQPGVTMAVGPNWSGSVPNGHPDYIPRQAIADDIHGYLSHEDDGHVNFIHTTPSLRGMGVGTKLLDHAGISDNAYAHNFTSDGRNFFRNRGKNKRASSPFADYTAWCMTNHFPMDTQSLGRFVQAEGLPAQVYKDLSAFMAGMRYMD